MAQKQRGTKQRRTLETVDLDLSPHEASDLLPIASRDILEAQGWELGFWTVLDEGPVERSIAAIGRARSGASNDGAASPADSSGQWEVARPDFAPTANAGRTEDAEALAERDGWVYVLGSHYGSANGPLEKKRTFVARFREEDFGGDLSGSVPRLTVALNRFRLHRAVNDALRAFGPELLPVGSELQKRFVRRTRKKGGTKAATRISDRDVPLNIEGAAFGRDGTLLVGLRFPVTSAGHPIVAEVDGIDSMLEDELAAPVVKRFWTLANVGTRRVPCGIRALHRPGTELHAIVGNLDGTSKDSALLRDHPEGGKASSRHCRFRLPRRGGEVEAEVVHRFDRENVEGVALGRDKTSYYVTDEDDRVHVRLAAAPPAGRGRGSSGGGTSRSSGRRASGKSRSGRGGRPSRSA